MTEPVEADTPSPIAATGRDRPIKPPTNPTELIGAWLRFRFRNVSSLMGLPVGHVTAVDSEGVTADTLPMLGGRLGREYPHPDPDGIPSPGRRYPWADLDAVELLSGPRPPITARNLNLVRLRRAAATLPNTIGRQTRDGDAQGGRQQ